MKVRTAARLAWSAWIASVLAVIASFVLIWLSRHVAVVQITPWRGFEGILALAFVSAGAPIAARQPRQPIGWLFIVLGGCFVIQAVGVQYAYFALLSRPSPLPGGVVAAWVQELFSLSISGPAFALLLLLFPTGRLPSPRWRVVAVLAVLSGLLEGVGAAFTPGPIPTFHAVENPYGVAGTAEAVVSVVRLVGNLFFVAAVFGGAVSLVVRFRRATGVERQQLKWISTAAVLVGVGLIGFVLTGMDRPTTPWARPAHMFFAAAITAVPVAAGIAMLRYRLYDIDRIINRTGAYASVTVLLGGTYAVLVFVFGFLLRPVAGGGDLSIAASVIAVAALFRPLRRRVQTAIDRRFDRARYDASRTIQAFSARLRDDIDLDSLGTELRSVVAETMRPQHVSLWLRPQRTPTDRKT